MYLFQGIGYLTPKKTYREHARAVGALHCGFQRAQVNADGPEAAEEGQAQAARADAAPLLGDQGLGGEVDAVVVGVVFRVGV